MISRKAVASARITEIFSSIQGEGPRMGERHIFIRFEACHMACDYCDESGKIGRNMFLPEMLRQVEKLERKYGPHSCVSLTGGEPLLYTDFLRALLPELRKRKFRVLLETSGVLWKSLSKVLRDCDIIAMDLKLPSVTRQGYFLKEHRKFLSLAKSRETYIKIVVSPSLKLSEYEKHLRMVAAVAPETPVFLQPISHGKKVIPGPALVRLLEKLQRTGAKWIPDIRLGIQLHKILNIR